MTSAAKRAPAPAQASIEDVATIERDERLLARLRTMHNWVLDLEAKLPAMRRELESLMKELKAR